uniref:Uncharacterized protein n=1 Tax=Sus scrofa TaxID=9823 RepID=A0A8D2CEA3_PIG
MMKFRLSPGYLSNFTNPNRPIPSNTLYIRYNNSLLISNTYLPRCKLWMNYPLSTCKRSINILHLLVYPCGPRYQINRLVDKNILSKMSLLKKKIRNEDLTLS